MTTKDAPTDVGALWSDAIAQYEKLAGVKLQSMEQAQTVEDVLGFMEGWSGKFDKFRHDGGKLDKLRSLVRDGLSPIDEIGGYLASAASSVRRTTCLYLL
jgi:hypothetical protein